jgi:hypothetical protein
MGRYCQFEPCGSSRRRREPPREWSTTAAPRTAAARGLAGLRAQRLLGAALREYARRQPRSATAAELPYKSPLKGDELLLRTEAGQRRPPGSPQARRLRLCLVSAVPFGPARRLVFSTSRTCVAESPRRIASLFAGCCLRLFLVGTLGVDSSKQSPSGMKKVRREESPTCLDPHTTAERRSDAGQRSFMRAGQRPIRDIAACDLTAADRPQPRRISRTGEVTPRVFIRSRHRSLKAASPESPGRRVQQGPRSILWHVRMPAAPVRADPRHSLHEPG